MGFASERRQQVAAEPRGPVGTYQVMVVVRVGLPLRLMLARARLWPCDWRALVFCDGEAAVARAELLAELDDELDDPA